MDQLFPQLMLTKILFLRYCILKIMVIIYIIFYIEKLLTGSWDCTIRQLEVVDYIVDDTDDLFVDENVQITTMATNSEQSILAYGDVEGIFFNEK